MEIVRFLSLTDLAFIVECWTKWTDGNGRPWAPGLWAEEWQFGDDGAAYIVDRD